MCSEDVERKVSGRDTTWSTVIGSGWVVHCTCIFTIFVVTVHSIPCTHARHDVCACMSTA